MIKTDYTEKATKDTLEGAPLSRYRVGHWLIDVLKNFMSDPVNIYDERIRQLLRLQDGTNPDDCKALFRIEPPYSMDTRKAGTTPCILVSTGECSYPFTPINTGVPGTLGAINAQQMYERSVAKAITASVAIVTESCDGTSLLADIIEDFIVKLALQLEDDGMVHNLEIAGSSAPQRIQPGGAANAKDLYQIVISLKTTGAMTWMIDTQGPVYRGVHGKMTVK